MAILSDEKKKFWEQLSMPDTDKSCANCTRNWEATEFRICNLCKDTKENTTYYIGTQWNWNGDIIKWVG